MYYSKHKSINLEFDEKFVHNFINKIYEEAEKSNDNKIKTTTNKLIKRFKKEVNYILEKHKNSFTGNYKWNE